MNRLTKKRTMRNRSRVGTALASACLFGISASPAVAATFGQAELSQDGAILNQFNLVNLGNFTSTATVAANAVIAGRALIGGTASVTGAAESICSTTVCAGNTATSNATNGTKGIADLAYRADAAGNAFSALTVFGNVTTSGSGSITTHGTTGGGSIYSAGASTAGTFSLNGGIKSANVFNVENTGTGTTISGATTINTTATTYKTVTGTTVNTSVSAATVFPFASGTSSLSGDFSTPLQDLYAGLANLPGSPGVTTQSIPSSTGAFTSAADYTSPYNGERYGVVTTTLANLQSAATAGFTGVTNNSSDQATIVIVTGFGTSNLLPSLTNSPNVIYDFVGASSLTINGAFTGTILAPLASVTQNTNGTVTGTVIVQSLTQTAALNTGTAFTGDLTGLTNFAYNARVPEPASMALLGAGVGFAASLRRRRK